MFGGLWQLTKRSLREESSRLGPHVTRVLMAGVLVGVIIVSHRDTVSSATGLPIFQAQLFLTHLFLMINAAFGFSQVIVEERESGTLDLLKLAGINRVSIIIGKSLPRFWESGLLIAVQFPFTLLTMTLGGVSWPQVIAGYATLIACLVLVAGMGLFASTVCQSSRSAVSLAMILLLTYLAPFVIHWLSWRGFGMTWVQTVSLQQRAVTVVQAGFNDSPWSSAVTIALFGGALFFIATWMGFESRLLGSIFSMRIFSAISYQQRRKRAWSTPLIWKDYYFLSGGVLRLAIRTSLHLGIFLWMWFEQGEFGRACAWTGLLGCPIGLIDGSWTSSRLFADEIRDQTWSVLVQTPKSLRNIAVHKTLGWGLGMLPSIFSPLLFIFVAIAEFLYERGDVDISFELALGSIVTWIAVFAHLHFVVLFSLDWFWKAIPATLITTCVATYLFMWLLDPWSYTIFVRCLIYTATGVILIAMIVLFQYRILTRLRELAAAG